MALYRPTQTIVCANPDGGRPVVLDPSTIINEKHWAYQGREQLFEPVEQTAERVEQATAAPGERRTLRNPKKPKAEAE
jgi:hypothetical protein